MLTEKQRQFEVTLPEVERISWVWCLFFAYAIPEVMAFARSVRICFFKNALKPSVLEISAVALAETLRTIGTGLLIFVVLPVIDVVKGAMLTNCLCFVPGLLGKTDLSRSQYKRHTIMTVSCAVYRARRDYI
jgi:chitin synthase